MVASVSLLFFIYWYLWFAGVVELNFGFLLFDELIDVYAGLRAQLLVQAGPLFAQLYVYPHSSLS